MASKAWVREVLNKHKKAYEYQVILKAKEVRMFRSREKAMEFAKMLNLILKEE